MDDLNPGSAFVDDITWLRQRAKQAGKFYCVLLAGTLLWLTITQMLGLPPNALIFPTPRWTYSSGGSAFEEVNSENFSLPQSQTSTQAAQIVNTTPCDELKSSADENKLERLDQFSLFGRPMRWHRAARDLASPST